MAQGVGYRRVYDAERAQRVAEHRARRPKSAPVGSRPVARARCGRCCARDWSPEQIKQHAPGQAFPDQPGMRVSHETIYQSLYVQSPAARSRRELTAHLRTQRTRRKAQTGGARRVTLGITEDIRISARPAEASRPGGAWSLGGRPAARRTRARAR